TRWLEDQRRGRVGHQAKPHIVALGIAEFSAKAAHLAPGVARHADAVAVYEVTAQHVQYLPLPDRVRTPEWICAHVSYRVVELPGVREEETSVRMLSDCPPVDFQFSPVEEIIRAEPADPVPARLAQTCVERAARPAIRLVDYSDAAVLCPVEIQDVGCPV